MLPEGEHTLQESSDHTAVHLVPEGENTHYRKAMNQRAIDLVLQTIEAKGKKHRIFGAWD